VPKSPDLYNIPRSIKYPEEDRAGRVIDQGLELPEKARGDHRATQAVANRIRIRLCLRNIGKRMQHDVPPERLIVATIQAI